MGEVVVGSLAEFEFADSGWPDAEVLGGRGEGEVLRASGRAEVFVVGDDAMPGERLEDLSCGSALRTITRQPKLVRCPYQARIAAVA